MKKLEEENKSGIFGFGGPDEEKIQDIKDEIVYERKLLKAGENELVGNFLAEKEALGKKYAEIYTGGYADETKDDFNLEDQRTLGQ